MATHLVVDCIVNHDETLQLFSGTTGDCVLARYLLATNMVHGAVRTYVEEIGQLPGR